MASVALALCLSLSLPLLLRSYFQVLALVTVDLGNGFYCACLIPVLLSDQLLMLLLSLH